MILKTENLSKVFLQGDREVHALKDVTFELQENEILAIQGPSGSGKSSLLALVAGLDKPTSGHIKMKEKAIHTLSEAKLCDYRKSSLGIVFQQFHLMPHLTAQENVELSLELSSDMSGDKLSSQAIEALEEVGLKQRADHLPHQLSGGEKQRVAIARALVGKPELILADEPSGNLDAETGQHVMGLLFKRIKKLGLSMILITHDSELASLADRCLFLKAGQLS